MVLIMTCNQNDGCYNFPSLLLINKNNYNQEKKNNDEIMQQKINK